MIHIDWKELERFNLSLKKRKENNQDKSKERKRVKKKKEWGLKVQNNVEADRKARSLIRKLQKSVLILVLNKDIRKRRGITQDPDRNRKTTIVREESKDIMIQSTRSTRIGISQGVMESLMKNEEWWWIAWYSINIIIYYYFLP